LFETAPVVWKEGLFLQPQHFQQWERFLLSHVDERITSSTPFAYGLTTFQWDEDAAEHGSFSVKHCSGILPDGTVFEMPQTSRLPSPRPFQEHFSPDQQFLNVYLALPLSVEGKANFAEEKSDGALRVRFNGRTISVTDEVSGGEPKPIQLGYHNFRIVFGDETLDNQTFIQIARLVRDATGSIVVDKAFVPPLLHIGASVYLMTEIRSLLELLWAKADSLSGGRRQRAGGAADFTAADESSFRVLQTINTYTPLLRHYHSQPQVHPHKLFELLTMFCGALATFSAEISIRNLPVYDHTKPADLFRDFSRIIRTILSAEISSGCVPIKVEQIAPATYVARVPDEKLFAVSRFYLGLTADVPEKELLMSVLQRIKMSSRDRLEILIPSAMPGLTLVHVANPPHGLSTKPGYVYFGMEQAGDFWQGIQASGSIAFYFPADLPGLNMEMYALRERN